MLYSHTPMPCLTLPKRVQAVSPPDSRSHICSAPGQSTARKQIQPGEGWRGEKLPQTPKLPPPFESQVDRKERR